jgi:hypothetical protein
MQFPWSLSSDYILMNSKLPCSKALSVVFVKTELESSGHNINVWNPVALMPKTSLQQVTGCILAVVQNMLSDIEY